MPTTNTKSEVNFRIVVGLIIGILIGIILNKWVPADITSWIVSNITQPVGTAFLRGLFMIVVPLVVASLAAGVADLGSVKSLGRLGKRAAVFYLFTTFVAVLIGQTIVNVIEPGSGVDKTFVEQAQSDFKEQTAGLRMRSEAVGKSLWPGIVEKIVPKNIIEEWSQTNMLSVIFVAIIFGAALLRLGEEKSKPMVGILHTISQATIQIVGWIMWTAPVAVACLMANAVVAFNISILGNVALYFGVVVLGYLLHFFITYGILVKKLLGMSPIYFWREMMPVFLTAFSTSSSNATLPTTIRHLKERFGVPEKIITFTAPLGATVNMDGTALFEVVAALFIA